MPWFCRVCGNEIMSNPTQDREPVEGPHSPPFNLCWVCKRLYYSVEAEAAEYRTMIPEE